MTEEISLRMDMDRVTLNDLVMLESPNATAFQVRSFLARCAIDADGKPMGEEQATQIIGNMPLAKIRLLTAEIADQMREANEVPPTTGGE